MGPSAGNCRHAPRLLPLLLLALALCATADAKPKRRDIAGGEYRVLNDHQFVTPQLLVSPFMNASLGIGLGFGALETEASDGGDSTRLLLFQQELQARFGIYNWASVEIEAHGAAAVGGDLEDVVDLGALAEASVGGRIKARIFTEKKVGLQLAVAAGAIYEHSLTLRPIALIGPSADLLPVDLPALDPDTLASLGISPDDKLLVTSGFTRVEPALMLAYGTGPFGLQLSVAAPVHIPDEGDEIEALLQPGVHVAFDIGHYTLMFPVAITAEYAALPSLTADGTTHDVIGGLSYSGRRDLELIAAFGAQLAPETTLLYGLVRLGYFF